MANSVTTFKDLGLCEELCDACEKMGWKKPTPIQKEAIPVALQGRDVVGLAETGSGKTGAFGLPILQALLESPQKYFALILTPTRELAVQIKEQFDELGSGIGLSCCAVVGGVDMIKQGKQLLDNPHIVVATLGRLTDHIKHLKRFSLSTFKYLVMDEADRILSQDFHDEVDQVIRAMPKQRTTMLFSATITQEVQELQRAHLSSAVKLEINSSFKLVDSLKQYVISALLEDRYCYLLYLISKLKKSSVIVFCNTRRNTMKTALILRQCGHRAISLFGDMSQSKRLEALTKFRGQERSILVATNIASRGLDISCVDYIINLEVPAKSEDYVHRVGRTARAGRAGEAFTFVSEYELEDFKMLEQVLETRIPLYPTEPLAVEKWRERIVAAEKLVTKEMRRIEEQRRNDRGDGSDEEEEDAQDSTKVRKRPREDQQSKRGGGARRAGGSKMAKRGRKK